MRPQADILHVDLDSFFAAVEQRDKPSLRGRPVVVGGLGVRGVVATASYEARRHGVRSAMPVAEARRRCPHAAYLSPRFSAYRAASDLVMAQMHAVSGLVQQVSIDEAYADLAVPPRPGPSSADGAVANSASDLVQIASWLRRRIREVTGGLTGSVGLGPSLSVAKLASESAKPDGLRVVHPADVGGFLAPLPVQALAGVGPATAARLRGIGIHTVAALAAMDDRETVRLLGAAHGAGLLALARGQDDRRVVAERETKSVSVEETFATDLRDPVAMAAELDLLSARVARRLQREGWAGRTVMLKMRFADFTTRTRSHTRREPLDAAAGIARDARRLLADVDTLDWSMAGGVRLLGVGVGGLSDWVQPDLVAWPPDIPTGQADAIGDPGDEPPTWSAGRDSGPSVDPTTARRAPPEWAPGADVQHRRYGHGWVWGSGLGRVTVRFEGPGTSPGPIRTFATGDPDLTSAPGHLAYVDVEAEAASPPTTS
ncbi:MAG: DNA polymerase IV [Angustibacter sp.]